ncbi:hypothetical protein PTI98_009020 [Pleurotus ostreatus]|nr:hypothetical protein PTI98_009020 [Pleurotus ostreatus]
MSDVSAPSNTPATPPNVVPQPPPQSGRTSWSHKDVVSMLECLKVHVAEAGEGGNFTKTVFTQVAVEVNKIRSQGAPKTAETCKTKYRNLKAVYDLVSSIQGNSGWSWDNRNGANITHEKTGIWEAYVTRYPKAAPFRNEGWVYLEAFDALVPSTAKGQHAYRTSKGTANPAATLLSTESGPGECEQVREPSPEWDICKDSAADAENHSGRSTPSITEPLQDSEASKPTKLTVESISTGAHRTTDTVTTPMRKRSATSSLPPTQSEKKPRNVTGPARAPQFK